MRFTHTAIWRSRTNRLEAKHQQLWHRTDIAITIAILIDQQHGFNKIWP